MFSVNTGHLTRFNVSIRAAAMILAAIPLPAACAGREPAVPNADWRSVIVQLRVAATESETQRVAAISDAREALLRELGSLPYRVRRAYETVPFVALDLSPTALRVVEQSALTAGIQPDILSAPQKRR
jgi:hypothetical protein